MSAAARPPRYLLPAELARWCAELEARCDGLEAVLRGWIKRVAELERCCEELQAQLDGTDQAVTALLEDALKRREVM